VTVYAHPDRKSFCHAVLERFSAGLRDGGHTNDVLDLYAVKFDPVLKMKDFANWLPDRNAPDVAERIVRERIDGPEVSRLRRLAARFTFRGKTPVEIVTELATRGPRDVKRMQERVARADALAFIAPVWFVGFPAMLKGWIERVFTLGFAFSLTSQGWRGDIHGRIPLHTHEKALVISTTIFDEAAYDDGLRQAMTKLIDEFALHYPGIRSVEHVYFHAVNMADPLTLQGYLEQAWLLGRDFDKPVRSSLPHTPAKPGLVLTK
jgi:NAD(P)H dehydrogenase (quinone)